MPEKDKNHYIPRFLLNRFGTLKSQKKKYFKIWVVDQVGEPRWVSTREIAHQKRFYGPPDSGVERSLEKIENNFSDALRKLDADVDPNEVSTDLALFVWVQTIRTKALRAKFQRAIEEIFPRLQSADKLEALSERLRSGIGSAIEKKIQAFPVSQQPFIRAQLSHPKFQNALTKQLQMNTTPNAIGQYLNAMQSQYKDAKLFENASESGQIKGLQKLLEKPEPPRSFAEARWVVVKSGSGQFILGDLCTLAFSKSQKIGSLLKHADDWEEVYLPIRPDLLLVAQRHQQAPKLDLEAVNQASAEHSIESIYAHRIDESVSMLQPRISVASSAFDEADWEKMLSASELRGVAEKDSQE